MVKGSRVILKRLIDADVFLPVGSRGTVSVAAHLQDEPQVFVHFDLLPAAGIRFNGEDEIAMLELLPEVAA